MQKTIVCLLALVAVLSVGQAAGAVEWHWERFGNEPYTGEITLYDHTGTSMDYQRFDNTISAPLFGASSVLSPIVVAGSNITIDMFRTGLEQEKISCSASSEWKVYLTPATACDSGMGSNMAGFSAWAEDVDEDTWIPQMSVFIQGWGWRPIVDHACGVVEAKQTCKRIEEEETP